MNDWGERTDELDGPQAAASSKLEAYAARLALILHLAASPRPQLEQEIGRPAIAAAIELVHWFAGEADRMYAMLAGDELPIADERLIQWVRRTEERATLAYLYRSGPKPWRGDRDRADADVFRLLQMGRLYEHQPPQDGSGRPRAKRLCVVA